MAIGAWKVWEEGGKVPSFVLEVVGGNIHKDYTKATRVYAELGVTELIVFDPFPGRKRISFQVYRRTGERFLRVEETAQDRVWPSELGCFVRVVFVNGLPRLRLGLGPKGDELFLTGQEAECIEKEAALAAKDAALAAKEAERAEKEAALARIAELEAELERARKGK
jgi:hypothetical protein